MMTMILGALGTFVIVTVAFLVGVLYGATRIIRHVEGKVLEEYKDRIG